MDKVKIEAILKEKITSITPLYQGLSNENFLINDKYVFRQKNIGDIFYHPVAEQVFDNQTFLMHLSPKPIHYFKNGNRISKYIPNTRYLDKNNENDFILIAKALSKLHSSKIKIKTKFSPLKRLNYYKKSIKPNLHIQSEKIIIKNYLKYKKTYVPCHNDIVLGNMLFKDNKLYLIDYEYAALNDPYFDLASFISENDIMEQDKITLFLNTYFKGNAFETNKLTDFIHFLDLLWYYWAMYNYETKKKEIYLEIANNKKSRL